MGFEDGVVGLRMTSSGDGLMGCDTTARVPPRSFGRRALEAMIDGLGAKAEAETT